MNFDRSEFVGNPTVDIYATKRDLRALLMKIMVY